MEDGYKELIEKLHNIGDAPIGKHWSVLIDKSTLRDVINVIERLVRDNEVLIEERDAAIAELKMLEKHIGKSIPKRCKTCELWGKRGWSQFEVGYCEGDDNPHSPNDFCSRWRGVQK